MEIEAEKIEKVWQALHKPAPSRLRQPNAIEERIATTGWATQADLEDLLLSQDRRLDPSKVVDPKAFAAALDLPFRGVFLRPKHRNDDDLGYEMLSAVDTAALCIWLERLGFCIDMSVLCARECEKLQSKTHLSAEEILVLFYEKNRHRLPPATLSAPHRDWRGISRSQFKTPTGYRLEYACDDDGRALWLTARAPKYRKRPDTEAVTCPDCGMLYVKGSRTDERLHRSFHRKRFSIIEPKPNRRFAEALEQDLAASWVDVRSPKWKRKEVYDRALEFKREFGYGFPQWNPDPRADPDAVGFLFSDQQDRIVGACAFRPQGGENERPWRLDWIWICPDARRQGQLGRHWERFRQRFGIFDIEPPISDAMTAFLRKRGCEELIC